MPTFVIKTDDPSVDFAIEAEEFNLTRDNTYAFYDEECDLVAELNAVQVLAIIREDHLLTSDYGDEDDVCDDCRTGELLDDPAFCNAVFDLSEGYHATIAEDEAPAAPQVSPADPNSPPVSYPVEYRKTPVGPCWGIVNVERNHFVPFGSEAGARVMVERYADPQSPDGWAVESLSNCPLVEVPSNG